MRHAVTVKILNRGTLILGSIDPSELTGDPEPWLYADGCRERVRHHEGDSDEHALAVWAPRPSYLVNTTHRHNRILSMLRGLMPEEGRYEFATWWQGGITKHPELWLLQFTREEVNHAARVLTRYRSFYASATRQSSL